MNTKALNPKLFLARIWAEARTGTVVRYRVSTSHGKPCSRVHCSTADAAARAVAISGFHVNFTGARVARVCAIQRPPCV